MKVAIRRLMMLMVVLVMAIDAGYCCCRLIAAVKMEGKVDCSFLVFVWTVGDQLLLIELNIELYNLS